MIRKLLLLVLLASMAFSGVNSYAQEQNAAPQTVPGADKKTFQTKANQEILDLKSKIIETQNKSELGFNKIVVCKSVEGFGVYAPLDPSQPSNKMIFYIEPSNYSTLRSEDRYIIDCSVDFQILDASGKPVLLKENASRINRVSRSPILDLYFKIELVLKAPKKPGSLILRIVLNDKIKNKSAGANLRLDMEGRKTKSEEQI